jgi:cytochrome c-type biogenesis protein CcmH/NrfF
MKKWRNSIALDFPRLRLLFALVMAGMCLAQTGDMVPPEVRRVGDRLACLCGSCNNTVATCQMVGCHYTAPARARLSEMHKTGMSDDAIVADFVKREGKKALAAPETSGFGLVAWVTPPLMGLAGVGFILWFVRRSRKAAVAAPVLDEPAVGKYQQAAERDFSRFEE